MPRGGSGTVHCCVAQAELLKLQSESALEVYYESMKRKLKIKTRLIDEKFASVRVSVELRLIRKVAALASRFPHFDLS